MTKPLRSVLLILLFVVLLSGLAFWLLSPPADEQPINTEESLILTTSPENLLNVAVQNPNGSYTMNLTDGQVELEDIPTHLINYDHAAMLIDECTNISYEQLVSEAPEDLSIYGLENPMATVRISYTDNTGMTLLVGNQESVSDGHYVMVEGSPEVYLFSSGRMVRFLGEVTQFIDYVIIPPNESPSLISCIGDITISGQNLPQELVIKAVEGDDEQLLTDALSFGAVTHMITSPTPHEVDPTYLTLFAESLLGLISEGVVDYNCTTEELSQYGFDSPLLEIEFDVRKSTTDPYQSSVLRLSQLPDGSPIVTVDDDGVVYRILDNLDFADVSYDKLVLRWFLSPLITEISQIELSVGGQEYLYELLGDTTQELSVTCNGVAVDTQQFRQLYTLLVSAAGEGMLHQSIEPPNSLPTFSLSYVYKNPQKPNDVLQLYPSENLRRELVEINGICEFEMQQGYAQAVEAAALALLEGKDVITDW